MADTYIIARECPLFHNGENLVYVRRVRLRAIAKELGVNPDGGKAELLRRLMDYHGFSAKHVRMMSAAQYEQARTEIIR